MCVVPQADTPSKIHVSWHRCFFCLSKPKSMYAAMPQDACSEADLGVLKHPCSFSGSFSTQPLQHRIECPWPGKREHPRQKLRQYSLPAHARPLLLLIHTTKQLKVSTAAPRCISVMQERQRIEV